MPIKRLSQSGLLTFAKHPNMLAGNEPVSFGAFDLLETTTLTTSASSVTFSGLDAYSDYKHLQIRAVAKTTGSTGTGLRNLSMRMNNDTTSLYKTHTLFGNGSSVTSNAQGTTTQFGRIGRTTESDETNIYAVNVIDILDFSSTQKNTTVRSLNGGVTSVEQEIRLSSGVYLSTDAITQISFFDGPRDLDSGSRWSLYGIKGA